MTAPANLCTCGAPLRPKKRMHPEQPEGVLLCTNINCLETWSPDPRPAAAADLAPSVARALMAAQAASVAMEVAA